MGSDVEPSNRRVSTLVHLCQRVAAIHVDSITTLGDHLRYDLVKPILERCTTDQLLRFEHSSPHLQKDTPEIWKDLCFRKYPTAVERYSVDDSQEPQSWKDRYFFLQAAEAKRLEEIGSKLRSQRLEADERKKEREVKLTDRVPPPKRARTSGWGANLPPKTLFQKTRTEASKIQKTMYNARVLPPMPGGRGYRVLSTSPADILPPVSPGDQSSRVTVNTVIHRRSVHTATPAPTSTPSLIKPTPSPMSRTNTHSMASPPPRPSSHPSGAPPAACSSQRQLPTTPPTPVVPPESRPLKSPKPTKKDPMASLFVPKHRAYSQRPV